MGAKEATAYRMTPLLHLVRSNERMKERGLLFKLYKITMKNEVLQEKYEKLLKTLHETMRTQTRELVAHVDINHHLGGPQNGGSPSFDMGIPDEERVNHQNIDQHETSLNSAASTRSKRSGGRHLLAEGLEGSKAVYRDYRDFLK
ncbi:hypothetical protein ACFX2G_030602 [Malus domestica]